jgi:nucleotide-binding universal stress UspA family protein
LSRRISGSRTPDHGVDRFLRVGARNGVREAHDHDIGAKPARSALLDAAQDAQLVVVGRRGRGGLPHMMLGTVAETLLSHTRCPVAVAGAAAGGHG